MFKKEISWSIVKWSVVLGEQIRKRKENKLLLKHPVITIFKKNSLI